MLLQDQWLCKHCSQVQLLMDVQDSMESSVVFLAISHCLHDGFCCTAESGCIIYSRWWTVEQRLMFVRTLCCTVFGQIGCWTTLKAFGSILVLCSSIDWPLLACHAGSSGYTTHRHRLPRNQSEDRAQTYGPLQKALTLIAIMLQVRQAALHTAAAYQ